MVSEFLKMVIAFFKMSSVQQMARLLRLFILYHIVFRKCYIFLTRSLSILL